MSDSSIELAEFISDLRTEMEAALVESADAKVRFKPGPIDLTLQVAAERSGNASGKLKFKILSLVDAEVGAGGALKNVATQTIKMTLEPVDASGEPILVLDADGDSF